MSPLLMVKSCHFNAALFVDDVGGVAATGGALSAISAGDAVVSAAAFCASDTGLMLAGTDAVSVSTASVSSLLSGTMRDVSPLSRSSDNDVR